MICNRPVAPLVAVRRADGTVGSIGPATNKKTRETFPGSYYFFLYASVTRMLNGNRITQTKINLIT